MTLDGEPISAGEDYGIGLRKGSPALKSALTAAVATIHANGQYTTILKRWGIEGAALK